MRPQLSTHLEQHPRLAIHVAERNQHGRMLLARVDGVRDRSWQCAPDFSEGTLREWGGEGQGGRGGSGGGDRSKHPVVCGDACLDGRRDLGKLSKGTEARRLHLLHPLMMHDVRRFN